MDIDDIPQEQTDGFPMGVTEARYNTEGEIKAFLDGVSYAHDLDVSYSQWFKRGNKYVARIKVGDF